VGCQARPRRQVHRAARMLPPMVRPHRHELTAAAITAALDLLDTLSCLLGRDM
jgi:hypothetical protein